MAKPERCLRNLAGLVDQLRVVDHRPQVAGRHRAALAEAVHRDAVRVDNRKAYAPGAHARVPQNELVYVGAVAVGKLRAREARARQRGLVAVPARVRRRYLREHTVAIVCVEGAARTRRYVQGWVPQDQVVSGDVVGSGHVGTGRRN